MHYDREMMTLRLSMLLAFLGLYCAKHSPFGLSEALVSNLALGLLCFNCVYGLCVVYTVFRSQKFKSARLNKVLEFPYGFASK